MEEYPSGVLARNVAQRKERTYGPRSCATFTSVKLETIWLFDLVVTSVRAAGKESNVAIPIAILGAEECKGLRGVV